MTNTTIEKEYKKRCLYPSDINEHLPVLHELAKECKTIAEFGVRTVVSTYALACARPEKLICVDYVKHEFNVDIFLELCKNENINVEFYEHDSRTFEMENVDLIFIDTKHNYLQLKQELEHLGNKANKYLVFHDTITFGHKDEFTEKNPDQHQGLVPAIKQFLDSNPHWKEQKTYTNCNGLTILERSV